MAPLFTPLDVAGVLGLAARQVVRGSLRHSLPWLKFGRALRMRPEALAAYAAHQHQASIAIKNFLGHSTVTQTDRYLHAVGADVVSVARVIEAALDGVEERMRRAE